jgi:predicted nucleic acid-binding Zn ribbon protein
MQKVSDEPLTVCEKCGGQLEKQWSRSGFQFKGSGWYVTDYSNKGKAESKSETKGESTATSNAEKSSTSESTAASPSASNTTKSDTSSSGKETK